jgi:hypothetical protein
MEEEVCMLIKNYNMEERYKANDYNGTAPLYKIRNFHSNVMLSAPHSVNQIRKENIKYAEVYTGFITEYLSDALLVGSITKTLNDNDDANFDDISKYRDEVVKLIKKNGIKFLIDIHGASELRNFDIEIGTAKGENINYNDEIVAICIKLAHEHGYKNVNVDDMFTASNKNTVSRYVNEKTKICAIQLEINKKHRSPDANPEEFEKMLKFMQHLIVTIDNYLNSNRFLDTITISNGRGIYPFNKIELPKIYFNKYGLYVNEYVELINLQGESVCCKVKLSDDDKAYVSMRYFDDYFRISDKASLFDAGYHDANILRPKIEIIDNNKIFVTDEIYESVKNKQIEIINFTGNRKIIMNVEPYPYQKNNKNSVYLNYYQRKLLSIEVPDILTNEDFTDLNNQIKADKNIDLSEGYYVKGGLFYKISPVITPEMFEKLSTYYRRNYCVVKWRISSLNSGEKFDIYDKLIHKQTIHLIAGRGDEKDDGNELVRMTPNTIKLLGIEETDIVAIKYNGSEVRLRALSFENMDMEKIMRSNGINNCEDIEYLIGIPAKYRLKLGIEELGTAVKVARDTKYLFVKNLNTQLLSIFGTIITITQLPIENMWIKGMLAALSIPVVMNVVFSYERAKI